MKYGINECNATKASDPSEANGRTSLSSPNYRIEVGIEMDEIGPETKEDGQRRED